MTAMWTTGSMPHQRSIVENALPNSNNLMFQ